MKVIIDIPTNPNEEVIYRNGVSFCGGFRAKVEENFKLAAVISDNALTIVGNEPGLLTLANLCYNLAQENVDDYEHIHVDKDGLWLLEGSESIIMVRVNNLE
jgi:hypothetical protein